MKLIRKDKKGFTLVELIVVIAILAILALILIPAITGYVSKAEKSKNEANARALYSQASFEVYTFDETLAAGETLKSKVEGKLVVDAGESVTISLNADNELVSITYTPAKGAAVTWPKP